MSSTQRSFRLTTSTGTTVAGAVAMAETPWQRFVGLMGRRELAADTGLCLRPCSSIHMFFMRIAVDAVFVDRDVWSSGSTHHCVPGASPGWSEKPRPV